ncbi:hypothetical protein MCOR25_010547 [Pyricularia grisea]|nr:hypothetical protein MCOR25_010547 [Pyricularia grisea]
MQLSITVVLALSSFGLAVKDFGLKKLSPPENLVRHVPSAETDWKAYGIAIKLGAGVGATLTDGEIIFAAVKAMDEVTGSLTKNQKRKYPGMMSAMRYGDYIYFGSSVKGGGQGKNYFLKTDLISSGPPPRFIANSPDYWMHQLGGEHIRGGTCAEVTAVRLFDEHQRSQGSQEFKWPEPSKTKFVAFSSFGRVEAPCDPHDPNCHEDGDENHGCKQLLATIGYNAPTHVIVQGNPTIGRWEALQFDHVDPTCPLH